MSTLLEKIRNIEPKKDLSYYIKTGEKPIRDFSFKEKIKKQKQKKEDLSIQEKINKEIEKIKIELENEFKEKTDKIIKEIEVSKEEFKKDTEKMSLMEVVKGVKGNKGDSGEKGEKGEQGEKGEKGDIGEKGERGIQGIAGKNGLNGIDGIDGKNGLNGKDGKDGSPDTPKQIAGKLNSLTEILELTTIKGLKEFIIKNMPKPRLGGGGGGGGMSNVIAETPSGALNGNNTTFTLTSNVKTNSLILLLNGQFQRPGASNEYTLSGKTITMAVAPLSTDTVFAWYIRS